MNSPNATYRVQLHNDFTFNDLAAVLPYLKKLGVHWIYASPIWEAVPGSTHGYDVVNPRRINPEIGTEAELRQLHTALANSEMGWLQDIVPNHMAFHTANGWLMDVLEKGLRSVYHPYFDIDWDAIALGEKWMVPFLDARLGDVIANGQITLDYQASRIGVRYAGQFYPFQLSAYPMVLRAINNDAVLTALMTDMEAIEAETDLNTYAQQTAVMQERLASWLLEPAHKDALQATFDTIMHTPDWLPTLLDRQVYRFCEARETDASINYRRFFTVNSLICLNVQHPEVFEAVHAYTKQLLDAGLVQGLRVDHIDGLYDPAHYLQQLRNLAGSDAYLVVEKILERGEQLPTTWPIEGTTGYDFLAAVNNLFTRKQSQQVFTRFYEELIGTTVDLAQELQQKKAAMLHEHMSGELDNLVRLVEQLAIFPTEQLERLPAGSLRQTLGLFLVKCPVYRYYGNQFPLGPEEGQAIQHILDQVSAEEPSLAPVVALLANAWLVKPADGNRAYNERALRFYQRCMQFTGPLMAKGVEDTLMYTYTRFIGHDEVGDSPDYFGLSVHAFHRAMQDRFTHWPNALNATATHDTKRGEDVRCRLNVLTDLAEEWVAAVRQWQVQNQSLKQELAGIAAESASEAVASTLLVPDANDEYFIYQTLLGTYPMPGQPLNDYPERLSAYLQKALREAKRYTTHDLPNAAYEAATQAFAQQLLHQQRPFWRQFELFFQQVVDYGILNSLAQVVLKCTCPGIPDVYQGTECWDLSMVDPDNRRPVSYDACMDRLEALQAANQPVDWSVLWQHRYNGQIKTWLLQQLLTLRQQEPILFREGEYMPIPVVGEAAGHVLAYSRVYQHQWLLVVLPLGTACLCRTQQTDWLAINWGATHLVLPDLAPTDWHNYLTPQHGKVSAGANLNELFAGFPIAVLIGERAVTG